MKILYFFVIGSFLCCLSAQDKEECFDLYYSELGLTVQCHENYPFELIAKSEKFDSIKLMISNNLGRCSYKGFKEGCVLERGSYVESMGLLGYYIFEEDLLTGEGNHVLYNYYQPIRESVEIVECGR